MEKMTNGKKVTNAMRLADIKAMLLGNEVPENRTTLEEATAFLDKQIEQLANKNKKKSSEKNKADIARDMRHTNAIMGLLLSLDEENPGLTCGDILRQADGLFEDMVSTQRIAYLLGTKYGLGKDGLVMSHKVKGEVRYKPTAEGYGWIPLVPDEEDEEA